MPTRKRLVSSPENNQTTHNPRTGATQVIIQILDMEPTPNPNAFKFVTDQELLSEGKKLNLTPEDQEYTIPLVAELFDLKEEIDMVMITDNFISVSGTRRTDWQIVHAHLERHIVTYNKYLAESQADAQKAAYVQKRAEIPQSDLRQQIEEIMETYVRPALAGDGGGVELVDIDGTTVYIRYQGACGSCPTSTANTLGAIENLLRNKVNPDLVLVPA